jgi:predicted O-linked N-acetylglucosamine transferase (SPINDLY family)
MGKIATIINLHVRKFLLLLSLLAVIDQRTSFAQTVSPIAPKQVQTGLSQNVSAWLQYIALELKKLRLELIEERCEKQHSRLSNLERELQLIGDQQREIEEEQNAELREPIEIDSQLAQPGISKEQREELEARKADLLAAEPSRFVASRLALAQREDEARKRIAVEQQRMQVLVQQAQNLSRAAK